METVVAHTVEDTKQYAARLVESLKMHSAHSDGAVVVTLSGALGAGKTTLVQELGRHLGVNGITSPTFILRRDYKTQDTQLTTLVHIDLYRLTAPEELETIGWDACVPGVRSTLVCVEWPERAEAYMPKSCVSVRAQSQGSTHQFTTEGI